MSAKRVGRSPAGSTSRGDTLNRRIGSMARYGWLLAQVSLCLAAFLVGLNAFVLLYLLYVLELSGAERDFQFALFVGFFCAWGYLVYLGLATIIFAERAMIWRGVAVALVALLMGRGLALVSYLSLAPRLLLYSWGQCEFAMSLPFLILLTLFLLQLAVVERTSLTASDEPE